VLSQQLHLSERFLQQCLPHTDVAGGVLLPLDTFLQQVSANYTYSRFLVVFES
jgi:hypothetical protein